MSTMPKPVNLRDKKRKLITRREEIPRRFASRAEEAAFWESHDFAPGVLDDRPEVKKELDKALGLEDQ